MSDQFNTELSVVITGIMQTPGVCDVTKTDLWESDWLAELEVEDDYRNYHKMSVAKIRGKWVIWLQDIESTMPLDEVSNYLFNVAASQLGTLRRENGL